MPVPDFQTLIGIEHTLLWALAHVEERSRREPPPRACLAVVNGELQHVSLDQFANRCAVATDDAIAPRLRISIRLWGTPMISIPPSRMK